MNLKFRFAILFSLSVFFILLASAVAIYILNESFRKQEFFKRVKVEAEVIRNLYFESGDSNKITIHNGEQNVRKLLPDEVVEIYDSAYNLQYITPATTTKNRDTGFIKLIKGNSDYNFVTGDREGVVSRFNVNNNSYYIIASATDIIGRRKIDKLKFILCITLLGGLLLSAVVAFFFVQQLVKPLGDLRMQMQNINESNLTERVKVAKNNDEISLIAKNFNDMLSRLEHSFEVRKSFVQHASHELRTPLANMLSQTESALNQNLTTEKYREVLNSLKEDQQNLIDLTNALLSLSLFDSLTSYNWQYVRIDELLYESIDSIKTSFPKTEITLDFDPIPEDESLLQVKGDTALLKSAIQNLLKNACNYSAGGSVRLSIEAALKGVTIFFENSGKTITPEESVQLFMPFFRGANSVHKKGFGLGLSIARRIVDIHEGTIEYRSVQDELNTFILYLPHEQQKNLR